MKKFKFGFYFITVFSSFILFLGVANAEILGCYKKNHGQLRIVSDHSQCLNSENQITLGDTTTEEPPPPPEPPIDNSRFYGIYSVFMKSGQCADFGIAAIQDDFEMRSAGFYTYLPLDGNFVEYSVNQYKSNSESALQVTIYGNQIEMVKYVTKTDESGRSWVDTMIFDFNEDYSAYTLTGSIGDDMPPECTGELTGYGQRLHYIEN